MAEAEKAPDWYDRSGMVAVFVCVVASIASNGAFGRGIGDVSCKYTQRFSPSNEAFGIWLPIYLLTLAPMLLAFQSNAPALSNLSYAFAWLSASLWTPAFTTQTRQGLTWAAVFLALTATFALAAVFSSRLWNGVKENPLQAATASAYAGLAGWTTVAAALNVGIAYQANDDLPDVCKRDNQGTYTIFGAIDPAYQTPVPLILACVVSLASTLLPDPALPIPLVWAIFWVHPSYMNYAAFAISIGAVVVSGVRVAYQ